MIFIILAVVLLGISLFAATKSRKHDGSGEIPKVLYTGVSALALILSVTAVSALSFVYVGKDEVVHLDKIYMAGDMRPGQIIANDSQKGPQARILAPGFHIIPFVRFIYDLDSFPVVTVEPNQYGLLIAKDGLPLRDGQVIADGWTNYTDMVNAETFLGNGLNPDEEGYLPARGQKGTQLTVLPPGQYRFNHYLFDMKVGDALQVKTGEVAVIRSNVSTRKDCKADASGAGVKARLVPKGCMGVWNEPLTQGQYYLNAFAYKNTIISTRVQVWTYKGGYTTKKIDLTVNDDGSITQQVTEIDRPMPASAADRAINVRVEGWTVPVELRVPVQISPENAPKVVAGIGSLQNVENRIVTPAIRDILRTIGGADKAKVLDFVSKRDSIGKKVLAAVSAEATDAGVTVLSVHLGEPAIPPELLMAGQRKQIADQLALTYAAEKKAQKLRVSVAREKATANQQSTLVAAEIAKKAAVQLKEKRRLEGEGEKLYLTQLAQGEEARANVLGKENVTLLKQLEIVAEHPELVKVPHINVETGGGSSLEGMAAIFGGKSNIAKAMVPSK